MRLSSILIAVPVGAVAAILAIANRVPVRFSLDPFGDGDPLLSIDLPLFALMLLSFALGSLVGAAAVGLRRRSGRREPGKTVDSPPDTLPKTGV